jgi:hypothetical protein
MHGLRGGVRRKEWINKNGPRRIISPTSVY